MKLFFKKETFTKEKLFLRFFLVERKCFVKRKSVLMCAGCLMKKKRSEKILLWEVVS